jgi:hypothetical protein
MVPDNAGPTLLVATHDMDERTSRQITRPATPMLYVGIRQATAEINFGIADLQVHVRTSPLCERIHEPLSAVHDARIPALRELSLDGLGFELGPRSPATPTLRLELDKDRAHEVVGDLTHGRLRLYRGLRSAQVCQPSLYCAENFDARSSH